MVLHLRKIISVLSALIIMMSASPVFAIEENVEETEEVQITETVAVEEPATKEIQEVDKKTAEVQSAFAYLTFFNEDGVIVLNKEEIEIKENTTVRNFVEEVLKDRNLKYHWEDLNFEYNGIEVTNRDFEKQVINPSDKLVVTVTKPDQPELQNLQDKSEASVMATETEIDSAHSGAVSKSTEIMDGSSWAYGNEWGVIGVSRFSSVSEEKAEKYCNSLANYIAEKKSATLSDTRSSDNARTILALTSLGYDPTDVNGYNLLEPLADYEYASKPYLSGPIWSLIAIDSHNYNLPKVKQGKTQTTREMLVDAILEAQIGEGWAFSGTNPDVDMTCMAIQALAPYRESDSRVAKAIEGAVAWLSKVQNEEGGYSSFGNVTSESASQVIAALTSVGINPSTNENFIKNQKSVVDSLLAFKASDGGFLHLITDSKYNTLATYQGCYSLTAYFRLVTNRTSLYDMSDMTTLKKFDAKPDPRKDNTGEEKKQEEKTLAAAGHTFSLGGRTIKIGTTDASEDLQGTENATGSKNVYNSVAEKQKLMSVLPWVYCGIGALAALALVLILRNRKPE